MSRFSTTISDRPIVVVAGEASGDRLAAHVLSHVDAPAFGLGGDALASRGVDLVAHLRSFSSMGVSAVAPRLIDIGRATLALRRAVLERRPRAALLVDFTELNARIGVWLRGQGVRVLWLVAPQVWAWRPGRVSTLGRSMDHLAALFPFEVRRWRESGVDARWVGHPSAEDARDAEAHALTFAARVTIEGDSRPITAHARWLPLLPGSRRAEVRLLLPAMLDAARSLSSREGLRPIALLASSLDSDTAGWARERCVADGVEVCAVTADIGIAPVLAALHQLGATTAICASGTATLECALAAIAPVIVYRTDRLSAAVGRALLDVDEIGLPNLVLGRRLYPELLQEAATPHAIAQAVVSTQRDSRSFDLIARSLRTGLLPDDGLSFGARVAAILDP